MLEKAYTMLHYPNISSGYIAKEQSKAAVTSQYFSLILNDGKLLEKRLIFPQRIPRTDFFSELIAVETDLFTDTFEKTKEKLKDKTQNLIKNHIESDIKIINYLNILLRFGMFYEVLALLDNFKTCSLETFEILLIKEIAKIEIKISNNIKPELLDLEKLCEEILKKMTNSQSLRLKVLNRLTVYHFRNESNLNGERIKQHINTLFKEVKLFTPINFSDYILKSIVYRGLAMYQGNGTEKQACALQEAELLARNAKYQNQLEQLIYQDNLLTCLQTLSKWNSSQGNVDVAENNLKEMITIDSYDSVVFSEMGIFLMGSTRYEEAVSFFKNAVTLGPPGKGMNLFLLAKCYEKINAMNEYVECLNQCILADEKALSPLLDLFYYYKSLGNVVEYRKFSKKILQNFELKSQLASDELLILTESL